MARRFEIQTRRPRRSILNFLEATCQPFSLHILRLKIPWTLTIIPQVPVHLRKHFNIDATTGISYFVPELARLPHHD